MEAPTRGKVKAMLMWGGMRASKKWVYYLRSKPALRAQQFTTSREVSKKTEILRASDTEILRAQSRQRSRCLKMSLRLIPCLHNLDVNQSIHKGLFIRNIRLIMTTVVETRICPDAPNYTDTHS
jgi:hypothetical protein